MLDDAPAAPSFLPQAARRSSSALSCARCRGEEMVRLSRRLDGDWIDLELCRSCDASLPLLVAIDRLVTDALRE